MAEGNGAKIAGLIEGTAAKWVTVVVVPALMTGMLAMGIWMGGRLVAELDELGNDVRTGFDLVDKRVDGIDTRLTATERDVFYLRREAREAQP